MREDVDIAPHLAPPLVDVRLERDVFVDQHDKPIAGTDKDGVRDGQAGTGIFLADLTELLRQGTGGYR